MKVEGSSHVHALRSSPSWPWGQREVSVCIYPCRLDESLAERDRSNRSGSRLNLRPAFTHTGAPAITPSLGGLLGPSVHPRPIDLRHARAERQRLRQLFFRAPRAPRRKCLPAHRMGRSDAAIDRKQRSRKIARERTSRRARRARPWSASARSPSRASCRSVPSPTQSRRAGVDSASAGPATSARPG